MTSNSKVISQVLVNSSNRTNGLHVPYRQDQRNPFNPFRMSCIYTKNRIFSYRKVSGVAAHPGLCDKGERAQFPLAIIYDLLKKS
jgi:hypothetical protein